MAIYHLERWQFFYNSIYFLTNFHIYWPFHHPFTNSLLISENFLPKNITSCLQEQRIQTLLSFYSTQIFYTHTRKKYLKDFWCMKVLAQLIQLWAEYKDNTNITPTHLKLTLLHFMPSYSHCLWKINYVFKKVKTKY